MRNDARFFNFRDRDPMPDRVVLSNDLTGGLQSYRKLDTCRMWGTGSFHLRCSACGADVVPTEPLRWCPACGAKVERLG